jgi:hypothetical protein
VALQPRDVGPALPSVVAFGKVGIDEMHAACFVELVCVFEATDEQGCEQQALVIVFAPYVKYVPSLGKRHQ